MTVHWRSVGPISLRGNVFFDAALALLTVVGVDTNELEGVFPMSPIDRINDEIEAALGRQSEVLGEIIAADLENNGLDFGEVLDAAEFAAELDPTLDLPLADGPNPGAGYVPEPASVLLISLLGLIGLRRRPSARTPPTLQTTQPRPRRPSRPLARSNVGISAPGR